MKLYEIDAAILACVDEETGEIIEPEKLEQLQMDREQKIEGVACWIKDLQAEAEALKAEKMAFQARQKAAESKAESLKSWLAYALGGEKFKSTRAAVSFRHTQAVQVDNLQELISYDDGLVAFQEPKPDLNAIKKRIKDGETVAGCTLKDNISTIVK